MRKEEILEYVVELNDPGLHAGVPTQEEHKDKVLLIYQVTRGENAPMFTKQSGDIDKLVEEGITKEELQKEIDELKAELGR